MGSESVPAPSRCWCGGELGEDIGPHYRRCKECGGATVSVWPAHRHFDVSDDDRDFYGRNYWTTYQAARKFPDIAERARADLSERCLFWIERLLEVTGPPGRALEIGCGHGGFVRLLQELGFEATGTELSPWVIEFAREVFGVRVLRGPLATLDLPSGFKCVAAFDVIEHLDDPVDLVRRCADLLEPDGVLLLQTPCYRGEGPDWAMFQEEEHVHLFTEDSIRALLRRAGFEDTLVRPGLFPYDMWVAASRGRFSPDARADGSAADDSRLPAAFRASLALWHQVGEMQETLAVIDADRAARLEQVEELTRRVHEAEAARVEDAVKLTALLQESEADRATRFELEEELTRRVRATEAARVEDAGKLTELLHEVEMDRAARLDQVNELTRRVHETDERLQVSEADRAARLEQVEELTRRVHEIDERLRVSEADRAARLEQVEELTRRVRESEAEQAARLHIVTSLENELRRLRQGWVGRLARAIRRAHRDGSR